MKKINICIVQPENYAHSYALLEVGELLYFSLIEIGFEARLIFNQIEPDVKNILLGCHLLAPSLIEEIPKSTVIINTEQIYNDSVEWNENIFQWVANFEVWDYSIRNIQKLNQLGVERVKHFKIGFQKELTRLNNLKVKDIDVLFYGSMNERRKKIIDKLIDNGIKVKTLFGVYGKERDNWIERSKVVLNHHFYNSHIFEIVRVFYLLTNSIPVVGEVNDSTSIDDMCREGIYQSKYENLVEACIEIVKNHDLREKIQQKAFESISKYPQKEFTREIMS